MKKQTKITAPTGIQASPSDRVGAKDKLTISNQPYEISQAAKALGVEPIAIHLAKVHTGSNDRTVIAEFIKKHKGSSVGVII